MKLKLSLHHISKGC